MSRAKQWLYVRAGIRYTEFRDQHMPDEQSCLRLDNAREKSWGINGVQSESLNHRQAMTPVYYLLQNLLSY
jgi:hypothetical protein